MRGTRWDNLGAYESHRFIPARAGNASACADARRVATVHPRACGERRDRLKRTELDRGSSPRVRGTPPGAVERGVFERFIPARAGNAPGDATIARHLPVHPRACGERSQYAGRGTTSTGSSPRVRGTRQPVRTQAGCRRFIPARAGNALTSLRERFFSSGSSPRVRGTLHQRLEISRTDRFIPARAGNAVYPKMWDENDPVHLRACGERAVADRPHGLKRRFIPARAGNATRIPRLACTVTVHPRACGERILHTALGGDFGGSSPRVRGTRTCPCRHPVLSRFIPARAGNAPPCWWMRAYQTVHPRACGERIRRIPAGNQNAGSSPRVRGTLCDGAGAPA